MDAIRKAGILALVGLLALAWVKLDSDADARTQRTTGDIEVECNGSSSRSPCAIDPRIAYPVGDGLFVTLFEDFL